MATITRPPAYATGMPADRGGEWSSGWRVALRLARRDVRRHKGRSALIVLMVAVPVLLLIGGNVLYSTQDLNSVERIPYAMGQTQAKVSYQGFKFTPLPDARNTMGGSFGPSDQTPTPIPGWGDTTAAQATAIGALTGSTAIPLSFDSSFAKVGRRNLDLQVLRADVASHEQAFAGMTRLISGRWPTTASEVAVTTAGVYRGLPSSGSVEVSTSSTDGTTAAATLTIVGTVEAWASDYGTRPMDLVVLPRADATTSPVGVPAFLIDRAAPVTWAEVKRLAAYGLSVDSRDVALNPPSRAELDLPEGMEQVYAQDSMAQSIITAVGAIGLLLETTLLVGPAFAVSAARSRRTLALAASNGATTAQLRRTVLAQALVLGVISALAGALLGILGAYAAAAWTRVNRPDAFMGPFELPTVPVLIVIACAIVSAVIAALVPARGLGRLDIVGVMRGQSVSPAARVRTPVAGLVLAGVGTGLVFWAVARSGSWDDSILYQLTPIFAMLGAVLLVVGTLLLVPMILVLIGRAAASAPVALRMALRDAARQRGRATSTVAAILAATALLSSILVIAASVAVMGAKHYVPRLPEGQAQIYPSYFGNQGPIRDTDPAVASIANAVKAVDLSLVVTPMSLVDTETFAVSKTDVPTVQPFFVAVRRGCTASEAVDIGKMFETGASGSATNPFQCLSLSGTPYGAERSGIAVGDIASLTTRYSLTASQVATLQAGGIVVNSDPTPSTPTVSCETPPGQPQQCGFGGPMYAAADIVDGKVAFARGTQQFRDSGAPTITVTDTPSLAAVGATAAQLNPGATAGFGGSQGQQVGALMSRATADALGLPRAVQQIYVTDPRGAITQDDESRLRAVIEDDGLGTLYVERGFIAYDWILVLIVTSVVGLIILVATLVSTALSTAETQSMMGTFAAVGATRATRRNLAAAQAGSLGVVGALLGVLVGLVPGIALARASTGVDYTTSAAGAGVPAPIDPTVVIPWLQLAIPVIGIPLLAAALAWVAIRRSPTVTRRLT